MAEHGPNILIVTTSHERLGETDRVTGIWIEELTTPYYAFADAGASVTVASIQGGAVPIDPSSQADEGAKPPSVERFLADEGVQQVIANTPALADIDASTYDAVFLPGGHGTMWDFPDNPDLAAVVSQTLTEGRVMAAVCHGPAGLVSAVTESGESVVKGRKVAAFTNSEEGAVGLMETVPFFLETRLRELGAEIHKVWDFEAYAIADGNLITGQNPASSERVAALVLSALSEKA